jgi:C1A family cysteine protease
MTIHMLGCLPDPVDGRDYNARVKLAERAVAASALPQYQDYRTMGLCPEVRDQDGLGSCVAFACTAMREFILRKQMSELDWQYINQSIRHLSPLDLYYRARQAMGPDFTNQDSGTYVRLGMDMLRVGGCLTEEKWPYVVADFAKAPPVDHADRFRLFNYWRIPQGIDAIELMKQALAQEYGIVLAVMVFDNVMNMLGPVNIGWEWPLPEPGGSQLVGWHAIFICGYWQDPTDPSRLWFLVHNSWGQPWGMGDGHVWMPARYIELSYWSDCWVGVA